MSTVFDYRIQGIPCQIQVLTYVPPVKTPEVYDPGEISYNVLDETGYKAEWLEEKMTRRDQMAIVDEIVATMEDQLL